MTEVFPSELTSSCGETAGAVAALDFLFVMLSETINIYVSTCLGYWPHIVSIQSCTSRVNSAVYGACPFRGICLPSFCAKASVGLTTVAELGITASLKQILRCLCPILDQGTALVLHVLLQHQLLRRGCHSRHPRI